MTTRAYYNEIDPKAAQWLRNLIAAGLIAPGDVDSRSILDVTQGDLNGYNQCHFFAGIGVWSYALRKAGWPDSRAVWTGSCPCQPFSAAGERAGFTDERHLWPAFLWLISQRMPPVVFGEQVASKLADDWLDLVSADLEALDFAIGASAFPSAGVGAPHIRDRLFWVADTSGDGLQGGLSGGPSAEREAIDGSVGRVRAAGGMADADCSASRKGGPVLCRGPGGSDAEQRTGPGGNGMPGGMAHADLSITEQSPGKRAGPGETAGRGSFDQPDGCRALSDTGRAGPVNGFWCDADWLSCRDGKWRPVEPGTFPLANGAASRVVRLRAYGNAINAEAALAFIRAYMDCRP